MMGIRRDQFASHVTLIAMLVRTGHKVDAIAIAKDARRFWSDKKSIAEIDAGLDGVLPPEALKQ